MTRKNLLSITRKFLQQNNLTDGICEGRIPGDQWRNGEADPVQHTRLIVFTGIRDPMDIKALCERNKLAIDIHQYENLDEYESNHSFTPSDVSLTYNWRGRILRYNKDFSLSTNGKDFERIFLKSYWRFILRRQQGLYYGNHDIMPLFYHPGSSTAGFEDPMRSIHSFLNYIHVNYKEAFTGRFDPHYDYVALFSKHENETQPRKFRFKNGRYRSEKTEWTHKEFCALIDEVGKEYLADAIRASFTN